MKTQLYLLELMIAMLCVGASTLLMHRGFDVIVLKAFIVAFVAIAIGLAFFWIYFVPRAGEKHQRTLGFVTSLIVGMGVAPWLVEPLAAPLFIDHVESHELTAWEEAAYRDWRRVNPPIPPKLADALMKKLESDGFVRSSQGNIVWYSQGVIRVQFVQTFQKGESIGHFVRVGWRAQGFWFQAHDIDERGRMYHNVLQTWLDDQNAEK